MKKPYFIEFISRNALLSKIIKESSLNDIDLSVYEHEISTPSHVTLRNITLGSEKFKELNIALSKFSIEIMLYTDDSKYFNNELYYFNQNSEILDPSFHNYEGITYKSGTKVLKKVNMFGREMGISMKTSGWDSIIFLSFIDKRKIQEESIKRKDFFHNRFEDENFIAESWGWSKNTDNDEDK